MPILLGLFSAASFGLAMVLVRIGMRFRPRDDGHFMSVLVNVLVLASIVPFLGVGPWHVPGILAFMAAGFLTTFAGRGLSLHAVRIIGPTRQGAFFMAAPLVAAFGGAVLLQESLTLVQAAGGLTILSGLALVTIGRKPPEPPRPEGLPPEEESPLPGRSPARGYLFAALGTISFGFGFVVAKIGIELFPSAIAGAFVGSATALMLITVKALASSEPMRLVHDNLRRLPIWFILSGILTSAALLARYAAFIHLPAWMVSVLTGTQGLWTVIWSYVFLRDEELLSKQLVSGVIIVTLGVTILARYSA